MKRALLILLLVSVFAAFGCAEKQIAPSKHYAVDLENQGFLNKMEETDAMLAKCKDIAMANCPDLYKKAKAMRDDAWNTWASCKTEEGWNKLKDALAAAKGLCDCKPAPTPPPPAVKKPVVISFDNILFDFDKSNIRKDQIPVADKIVATMMANPDVKVVLKGNTDSIGTKLYNLKLSDRRAKAVRDYLVKHGVSPDRIVRLDALGFEFPVAPNKLDHKDNPAGRALNRRVETVVYKTE